MAENFNPRPRKEGDNDLVYCSCYRFISIHALVKRATAYQAQTRRPPEISIHALAKRATALVHQFLEPWVISIHALVKRATRFHTLRLQHPYISIHALVKRATDFCSYFCNILRYFNPRPRKEGDSLGTLILISIREFQSTPSQRGRPSADLPLRNS